MVGWTVALMETLTGFLLVVFYAQPVEELVSKTLYPPVIVGVILQLVFGARLLWLIWKACGSWAARRPATARAQQLTLWAGGTLLALLLHLNAFRHYTAQLPEAGGSYLRFYFGTWELWLLLIAAVGLLATASYRARAGGMQGRQSA